ncbi:MAG: transcriptional repressor NrdR [Candidatus Schekmanbacteria bacterium]|nr:MAG: transcriptional repressor NrdR [Candidatus Schekmanbacteria bacterium]
MKCPNCGYNEDKVVDSRTGRDGTSIRRRRECLKCGKRFTTYERIENVVSMVIKKDGRREPFDRQKIFAGIAKACEKRPISINEQEALVEEIEMLIRETGEKEIPSSKIGEFVINKLHELDDVAYVRFASVYKQFKDINEFMKELSAILSEKKRKPKKRKK